MEISAQLVKILREKTGSGMMDCKRALVETFGDIEAASDLLRKKGLMDAAKKSTRVASDGLVAIALSKDKKIGSIIEINSETDFVARNEKFQNFVSEIANLSLETSDIEEIMKQYFPQSKNTVKEELDTLISLVGENITIRKMIKITANHGIVASYMHNAIADSMGKIGILVGLELAGDCTEKCCNTNTKDKIHALGKKIAMHIAAANPSYLSKECVPVEVIAKERAIILAQAKEQGKNEEIAIKMSEGRIAKFCDEYVLLEQIFVIDGKKKVCDIITEFNKENNCYLSISTFKKFVLGEGIENSNN